MCASLLSEFTQSLSPRTAHLIRNRGMLAYLIPCRGPAATFNPILINQFLISNPTQSSKLNYGASGIVCVEHHLFCNDRIQIRIQILLACKSIEYFILMLEYPSI